MTFYIHGTRELVSWLDQVSGGQVQHVKIVVSNARIIILIRLYIQFVIGMRIS